MKVLLREDVENLGFAGEVHDVAPGFGRNYLIPKELAVLATPGMLKQANNWRKKAEAHREEIRREYEALTARIQATTLNFTAKAGESGKLFGSVTTSQIADDLNEALGTDIDRRKVGVEPLRQLGTHQVVVRLSGDFQPELTVVIKPEVDETVVMEEPVTPEDLAADEADEEVEEEAVA